MQITAGAVGSVGLAGGFGQGGGHGAFGPKYGLMVDNAVEFDVVTADGQMRTINECNDPDLFYAMRGGGGGTYAVMLNYKFKVYPEVPMHSFLFQANFSQPVDFTQGVLKDLVTALVIDQSTFLDNNVAGYNFYYPTSIETYQILPEEDGLEKLQNLTARYKETLENYSGLTILQNEYISFDHQTDFAAYTTSIGVRDTPRGYAEVLAGRLIPRTQFQGPENQDTLVEKFLVGMQTSQNPLDIVKPIATQIYATGPANQPDNSKTGVNPAWRGSLWEVVYAGGWVEGVPQAVQDGIHKAVHVGMDSLREITPGGGCYVNEADYLEEDWQTAFFGSNYDRLLSIKQEYDPSNFFNCWRCVGWNGADDPQYSCYGQSQNPLVSTNPL